MPSLMMMIGGKTRVRASAGECHTHLRRAFVARATQNLLFRQSLYSIQLECDWACGNFAFFFPKFAPLLLGAMGNMVMQSDRVNIAFEFAISPSVSRIR